MEIQCSLGEIVVLKAPVIRNNKVKYYLYNPRGGFSKLDIKGTSNATAFLPDYGVMSIKNIMKKTPIVTFMRTYTLFNMFHIDDLFKRNLQLMGSNEFMLGPLGEDDFGNWVLSAYYQDDTGEWTEVFQSFALMIMGKLTQVTKLKVVKPLKLDLGSRHVTTFWTHSVKFPLGH